mmetsp:Transcript_21624/g.50526  ORF Transcript_21624/g.50526 Transcript_21624/m.50526 type:complete len:307 (+) Transcript_21624:112-1032(+)
MALPIRHLQIRGVHRMDSRLQQRLMVPLRHMIPMTGHPRMGLHQLRHTHHRQGMISMQLTMIITSSRVLTHLQQELRHRQRLLLRRAIHHQVRPTHLPVAIHLLVLIQATLRQTPTIHHQPVIRHLVIPMLHTMQQQAIHPQCMVRRLQVIHQLLGIHPRQVITLLQDMAPRRQGTQRHHPRDEILREEGPQKDEAVAQEVLARADQVGAQEQIRVDDHLLEIQVIQRAACSRGSRFIPAGCPSGWKALTRLGEYPPPQMLVFSWWRALSPRRTLTRILASFAQSLGLATRRRRERRSASASWQTP